MSGNPDKASIWGDADVYIDDYVKGTPPTLPASIDDIIPANFDLVGLLDGDAGFEESQSRDSSDFFAWGGLLIRTSRRNFVLTRKFTALEDNPVVRRLVWPGSGPGERVIPKPNARFIMIFETEDGDEKKRAITSRYAEVEEVATIKQTESDLEKFEITVKIYPTAGGKLFDIQGGDDDEDGVTLISVSATPATKALAVGAYAPLLLTATFSDATTRDVTALAAWATSAGSKAAVDRGYIHGIAAGTANVTGTYRGQADTCAVTVS